MGFFLFTHTGAPLTTQPSKLKWVSCLPQHQALFRPTILKIAMTMAARQRLIVLVSIAGVANVAAGLPRYEPTKRAGDFTMKMLRERTSTRLGRNGRKSRTGTSSRVKAMFIILENFRSPKSEVRGRIGLGKGNVPCRNQKRYLHAVRHHPSTADLPSCSFFLISFWVDLPTFPLPRGPLPLTLRSLKRR